MNKLKTILQYNWQKTLLLVFLLIYVIIFTIVIKYHSQYDETTSFIEGKITNYSINGDNLKLDVKGKEKIKCNYYIKSKEEKEYLLNNIKLGTIIKLNGNIKEVSNNTIPNTFNYKKYLYNHKMYYTFTVDSYELSTKNNFFYQIKDFLLKRIYSLENNEYLLLFLLGDKSLISSEDYQGFQLNGTAHLLAISGMHIGVLISLLNIILKKISENKKIIITSLVLLFFAFLTNFSASVLRVILFFIIMQINKKLELNYSSLQVLFIVAYILIIFNPFIIFDYGFLYSVIITGGIIYYNDKIKGNYFVSLLKLSIITLLFSLPITASLNYEINLTSIIANLIFVPLVTFIVYPWALLTIIIPNPLWKIIINLFVNLSNLVQKLSIIVNIPKISFVLIMLFYLFLIIAKNKPKLYLFLVIILILNKIVYISDSNYYVYILDMGQGDSSILISPHQKEVVMIDTGGKIEYEKESWQISSKTYNLSDNTIKFLKSLGINKIDYLIISHGDADHAGEALNIINNIKVQNVVFNIGDLNYLEKKIKETKINITDKYQLKYFQIKNLNEVDFANENDNSIVNFIKISKFNFLFMGDASIKSEENILKKYNLPSVDILKVGHHGSNTSSSKVFIDCIKPKYSLISVGKNNKYGHPKTSVLNILSGSKIYRTDIDGSIKIKLNKKEYKISSFPP